MTLVDPSVSVPAAASAQPTPEVGFAERHIGVHLDAQVTDMLRVIGQPSLSALVDTAVPTSIRQAAPLNLARPLSEADVLTALRALATQNTTAVQLIGQGYSDTITPAVIRRNVLESPAWYTAYTPYQPEISQGRLEALLNFQTMVQDLTGLDVAGASLLDEGTAVVEAALLMRRATRGLPDDAPTVIDADAFPQTIALLRGRAEALGFEIIVADLSRGLPADLPEGPLGGVIVQQPGVSGAIVDHSAVIAAAHERGALVTVATDLLALTLLTSPGEQGADIAVGSAQRMGVPLFFGGPHAAFISVKKGLERQLPGRLVGVSVDDAGRPAYRLALQTREQHIRREKATSNICTAQALLAVVASFYAVYHGPEGLTSIARRIHRLTTGLRDALESAGITVVNQTAFDTLTVAVPGRAAEVLAAAEGRGINLRRIDGDHVGVAVNEVTTARILDHVLAAITGTEAAPVVPAESDRIPAEIVRTSAFLTHPVFHQHRSETQLLRYIRRLSDRDLALDRTMIPLGSCTMKLNAAVEMEAISWPEFASIHPFAPDHQTVGWRTLITELEEDLAEITGYDRVSVQPNAGSQGELAGLLAIRGYHRSRGDEARTICLIPASAHGTNAASAVLAGMRVVVVATAADGTIDHADLNAKIAEHRDVLAAIMITYPSTHGVFDTDVREVCDAVHAAGGQVYIDGANLNALVGLAKPGEFGGDVSHLNLHKTFCIPHGGGGPGVGPVAVRAHLAPFLPGDATDPNSTTPISSARFGSAGVLPISWAYVRLMGGEGLTRATRTALLSANYLAARLDEHFPVLYRGNDGLVAHECILDLRPITAATGVTAEDVAKRLMDFGFHAPTLSFPVPGTLMVEPTESEDIAELERFVTAMRVIRAEIASVEAGEYPVAESPLRRAPHTAAALLSDTWDRPYGREQAAFPVPGLRQDKYFPPVGRINQAAGDRNLICSCPPLSAFEETSSKESHTEEAEATR